MATKDTSKRALVVVDVQNEYISGNFLITYPDPKVSMANILAAMDAAKKAGIPVITVQHSLPAGAPIFAADSDNFKLHPDVAARDAELNLVKGNASSFSGTELKSFLESKNIGTVAVIGYMTHNCVDSTVREAAHKGYEVEVRSPTRAARCPTRTRPARRRLRSSTTRPSPSSPAFSRTSFLRPSGSAPLRRAPPSPPRTTSSPPTPTPSPRA